MIKVEIIQTKGYRSNDQGIKKVSKLLDISGNKGAQIVCLPEQWLKNNLIKKFDSEFLEFKKIFLIILLQQNFHRQLLPLCQAFVLWDVSSNMH